MDWKNIRTGTVACDANMSDPLTSRENPGWECVLHKYPIGGRVWIFMGLAGDKPWSPEREATEAGIEAFRQRGMIRPGF